MLRPVSEKLSIAQVTPYRRGSENPVNRYVEQVSVELERRGHERADRRRRRSGQKAAESVLGSTSSTSTSPFAPRVSSAALRHSSALNVATFHAPQERVLSTQVARPLVEIFFGRIDARTVATASDR